MPKTKKFFTVISVTLLSLFIVFLLSSKYRLMLTATKSIDATLIFVVLEKYPLIKHNDLVVFDPPHNSFYKDMKFIKYVRAVPGDRVTRQGQMLYINDNYVATALKETRNQVPLVVNQTVLVGKGEFMAMGTHQRSFDSRYDEIGNIKMSSIIGKGYIIF